MLHLCREGQPCVLAAAKEPSVALARGRARTANTGAAACYIRPVKLRPLLPSPRGRCPASVPALLGAAVSIKGSPAYFPQLEGLEEKGSCPLLPVCISSALHGVKGPRHQPLGESPLGTVGGGPFDQPSLLGSGLGGVTRHSPPRCRFPHTSALVKVTLSCTCPDRCPEL